MATPYRLEKLNAPLGAIVHDIDLKDLDEIDEGFLQRALNEHLVLFFRDQHLEPESLYQLAARFGKPVPYPFVDGIDRFPEIVEIRKLPEESVNFGGVWHSDTAYMPEPAKGAFLYGDVIPEHGGDTIFSNMYSAYASLSSGFRSFLETLIAINDADKDAISQTRPGQPKKGLTARHPVIRTHPITGNKLLFVDRAHTTHFSGWAVEESRFWSTCLMSQKTRNFAAVFNGSKGVSPSGTTGPVSTIRSMTMTGI